MGWRLRLSDKTVRKFAELPIYCQRQKCSPGNVVSGSIKRFMQIFAGVRWIWCVKWEWGSWKWPFSLHSITVFRTFYIHCHTQLSGDTTVNDLGQWAYFKVIGLFHIKFLKNGAWFSKNYYRPLIGNHSLAFDWCHFWWPWSTFEGHFSLGCHFYVHFSNPWHAFASLCPVPHWDSLLSPTFGTQSYPHCWKMSYILFWIGKIFSWLGPYTI